MSVIGQTSLTINTVNAAKIRTTHRLRKATELECISRCKNYFKVKIYENFKFVSYYFIYLLAQ